MTDPTTSASPTPPQLDYGQRQRMAWIGRHRKLLIFLAVCFAIALPAWWYWVPIKHWVLWQYWMRQAAAYQMPESGQITGAQERVTLPNGNGSYYEPRPLNRLRSLDGRFASLGRAVPPPLPVQIRFMGMMRRPDGAQRIVIIAEDLFWNDWRSENHFGVLAVPPVGLFEAPPQGSYPVRFPGFGAMGHVGRPNPPYYYLQLESAQPDPADPSHLTIPYVEFRTVLRAGIQATTKPADPPVEISRGQLDVRLQNDDSVIFTTRQVVGIGLGPGRWNPDDKVKIEGDPTRPSVMPAY